MPAAFCSHVCLDKTGFHCLFDCFIPFNEKFCNDRTNIQKLYNRLTTLLRLMSTLIHVLKRNEIENVKLLCLSTTIIYVPASSLSKSKLFFHFIIIIWYIGTYYSSEYLNMRGAYYLLLRLSLSLFPSLT